MGWLNCQKHINYAIVIILMLSLNKPKNKKKLLSALPLIIVAAAVIAGGLYLLIAQPLKKSENETNTAPTNTINYDPPSEEEKTTSDAKKDEIIDNINSGDSTPNETDVVVTITRADQAGAGQPLNIRAFIDGTKTGQCKVIISKSGQSTVEKSFPVVFEGTGSSCQNADIDAGEFSTGGEWTLTISVVTGSGQSKATDQKVTIDK